MSEPTENKTDVGVVLDMQGVTKQFPGTLAVDSVNFQLRAGEVHALIGENGAGKSTLMKMMAGSFNDYSGKIFIGDKEVELHSPADAKACGIGMIYQELSLARPISIMENLLAGRIPKKKGFPFIDRKVAMEESQKLLARVGLEYLDPNLTIAKISQCEAQLVEIAKTLGNKPCIIVMDEPTSALSSEEVNKLFAIINQLKNEGIAIAYISHHLPEIFAISDRVTVMRDGKHIGTYVTSEVDSEKLVELMVGRAIDKFYDKPDIEKAEELFRVENISRFGFFHNLSFSVRGGEILGISGLAGAGRSELARSIVGVDPLDEGKLYLDGKEIVIKNMNTAIQNGIAYLTESRKTDGLALPLSISENTLSAIIPELSKSGIYNEKKHGKLVWEMIEKLQIYPPEPNRPVNNLSGGNQQKVLMAKWIMAKPRLLILDEPTRGVDIGAKEVIHKSIVELAEAGNAVVLITSDLPEMVGLADRAIIMRNGHFVGEIDKEHMSESSLLLADNGKGGTCIMSGETQISKVDNRATKENTFTRILNRMGIYIMVLILVLIGAIAHPTSFLTSSNLLSTIQAVSILGMVVIGIAFVVYGANFNDMSLPMTIAFSGMIAVSFISKGFWFSAIAGSLAGMSLGVINGIMIGKFRAHPIIWSMAFNFVMSGIVRWAWSGQQIYPDVVAGSNIQAAEMFFSISRRSFLGIPLMVIVMLVMFVVAQFVLTRTKFGSQLKVTGSNYEVARLSGINVVAIIIIVYVINAFCASVSGLFLTSMSKTGAYYLGEGYDFRAVTAVLLGGMSLDGGKGDFIGVFGGVLTLGLLSNIMTLSGISTFNQWLVQGIVFLLIVWLSTNSSRRLGRG